MDEKTDRVYDPNALDLVERMDASGGEYYITEITQLDGMGDAADYYHAIATRGSDRRQLIFTSRWLWLLRLRTRPEMLKRAFARVDKRVREYERRKAEVRKYMR